MRSHRAAFRTLLLFAGALAALSPLHPTAQTPPKADAEFLRRAYDTYSAMRKSSPFQGQSWSYLGPTNISGRATDVAVADKDGRRRIYVAYATSGIWKTDDDGATWQVIWEHMPSTSIGDIAVTP